MGVLLLALIMPLLVIGLNTSCDVFLQSRYVLSPAERLSRFTANLLFTKQIMVQNTIGEGRVQKQQQKQQQQQQNKKQANKQIKNAAPETLRL